MRRRCFIGAGSLLIVVAITVFAVLPYFGQEPLDSKVSSDDDREYVASMASDGQAPQAPGFSLAATLDETVAQVSVGEWTTEDDSFSPVALPSGAVLMSTQQNEWGRGRTYRWVGVAATAAQDILRGLDDGRWELIHASTLDLYGEAWGCVVREKGGSRTFMVYIAPTSISAYSTECSELSISISEMGVDR